MENRKPTKPNKYYKKEKKYQKEDTLKETQHERRSSRSELLKKDSVNKHHESSIDTKYELKNFSKTQSYTNAYSYKYNPRGRETAREPSIQTLQTGSNNFSKITPIKSPIRTFKQHLSQLEDKLSHQSYNYSYHQSQNLASSQHQTDSFFERELDECKKAVFVLKDEFDKLHTAFENRILRKKVEWERLIREELEREYKVKFRKFDNEIEKRSYELGKIENLLNEKDKEITSLKERLDEYGNLMIDMKNKNIGLLEKFGEFKKIQKNVLDEITRAFDQKVYETRKSIQGSVEEKFRKVKKLKEILFGFNKKQANKVMNKAKKSSKVEGKLKEKISGLKSEIEFLKSEKKKLNKELNYEKELNKKLSYDNKKLKSRNRDFKKEIDGMKGHMVSQESQEFKHGEFYNLNFSLRSCKRESSVEEG